MTKRQDEALRVLAGVLIKARGPTAEAAFLLVDAVRNGTSEEITERTEDLRMVGKP